MAADKNITLESFMSQNAAKPATQEYIVSDRFTDSEGKPIPWKLHAISGAKDAVLRRACSDGIRFDNSKYATMMVAATVRFPNLKDAALQDSYEAHGETDLLEKMLLGSELNALIIQAQIVNGYAKDINDLKEQAKNL